MKFGALLDADWQRLQFLAGTKSSRSWFSSLSPRFAPVTLMRAAQMLHRHGWGRCAKTCSLINFILFGLEVSPRLDIGPGFVITHTQGTVLGAARIGANVTIYQQVTLGAKKADFGYDLSKRPIVEDNVIIAAGAKVLGPVILGQGCRVGANAVVIRSVPPGAQAIAAAVTIMDSTQTKNEDD